MASISILAQKQQLDVEKLETEKALEELKKAADTDTVYKQAGSILIKSNKSDLISELEEKKELANTRATILSKQEIRVKESMKEQETKINEMMKGAQGNTSSPSPSQQPPK